MCMRVMYGPFVCVRDRDIVLVHIIVFLSVFLACNVQLREVRESADFAMDISEIPRSILRKLSNEQQCTLKLLLKTKDQEIQCKVQELELKELKFNVELKKMEDRLCAVNYTVLLSQKLLTVRSLMCFVRDEFLCKIEGTHKQKFKVLADDNPELLKKWKINKDEYYKNYQDLMKKLNQHAHPLVDTKEAFILAEDDLLTKEELKLIGFLWSVVPLPEKNLFIRKNDNHEVILLIEYIKE